MSFYFGFFDSYNADRKYNAEDLNRIVDGFISDGIYTTVGDSFKIKSSSSENSIIVGSGRARFNEIWCYNTEDLTINGSAPPNTYYRYDAIAIDIDRANGVRNSNLLWITGRESSNPFKPAMVHTNTHDQYPLCYVYRRPNTATINLGDIIDNRGNQDCPYSKILLADVTNLAQLEMGEETTRDYTKNSYLLWKNDFYKTTKDISEHSSLIPYPNNNYNIKKVTVGEIFDEFSDLMEQVQFTNRPSLGDSHGITSGGVYTALGSRERIDTSAPTRNSRNLITSGQVYAALGNRSVIPDIPDITITDNVVQNSEDVITSGGVYTALGSRNRIDTSAPTQNSSDLITSGQVYAALGNRSVIPDIPDITITDNVVQNSQDVITSGGVYNYCKSLDLKTATYTGTISSATIGKNEKSKEISINIPAAMAAKIISIESVQITTSEARLAIGGWRLEKVNNLYNVVTNIINIDYDSTGTGNYTFNISVVVRYSDKLS